MAIRFERDGHVATLTLDRPEKLNAMDREMYAGISERLRSTFIGGIKHMPVRFTPQQSGA